MLACERGHTTQKLSSVKTRELTDFTDRGDKTKIMFVGLESETFEPKTCPKAIGWDHVEGSCGPTYCGLPLTEVGDLYKIPSDTGSVVA